MPKSRLSRHLFGTYAVALVTVLAGCYWLSIVRMASVTEEAEFKRMVTAAVGLADLLRDVVNSSREEQVAQLENKIITSKQQKFEVFDFQGNRLGTTASKALLKDDAIDTLPDLKYLLDETKSGMNIIKTP